jgi:teichoic acid transport system permease protein
MPHADAEWVCRNAGTLQEGNSLIDTIKEIAHDHVAFRKQLFKLAKTDIIKKYRGAAFGWAWAVIRPSVTIFVYWFAFSVGLRHNKDMYGYSFFLWLIAGMIPWFYMRDALQDGAKSIRSYKYLVKRIKYPVDTIPTFMSMADLLINIILQAAVVVIFMLAGHMPDLFYLQIPLYLLMMFAFFTAWSLFAGMLSAMSKDFQNLVNSVVPALFWLSGIMYDANSITQPLIRKILLFNPVTIIANGYRNAFIYKQWFWESSVEIRNYVFDLIIMILLAIWAYNKLKKDIPDVL